MGKRGTLTDKIQEIAVKHTGSKITQEELRLLPYVQYVMMNGQKLDIAKISSSERDILKKWKDAEYIEGGASGLAITREFWDFMCDILFEAYVDTE